MGGEAYFQVLAYVLVVPIASDGIEGKEADVRRKSDTDLGAKLGAKSRS